MKKSGLYSYSAGILVIAVYLAIGAVLGTITGFLLSIPLVLSACIGGVALLALTTFTINRWLLCSDEEDK
jgi:predicted benzoate:H+ symporter BenE